MLERESGGLEALQRRDRDACEAFVEAHYRGVHRFFLWLTREAETAVTIDDCSTLVISGLRMSRTTTRENKVPGLGDLPLLGWLFKNHRSQQQLTDLYFFVTPTLL